MVRALSRLPRATAVVMICLLAPALLRSCEVGARTDPETGRIRLLHIGDAFNRPGFASYFFFQDPRIDVWAVPSEVVFVGETEVHRYFRLYLPRTRDRLRDGFDVVCPTAVFHNHLPDEFLAWTREAVLEEGVGFLMADDLTSFGGRGGNPDWADTVLAELIAVKCVKGLDWGEHPFKVDIVVPDHPLTAGIPWGEAVFAAHNRGYEREGSTVLMRTIDHPSGLPALAYLEVGKAISIALIHDWGGRSLWSMSDSGIWAWAPHFYCSLVYYSAGAQIPDAFLDRTVREKFHTYTMQRLVALSMIEFAEIFGADSTPLLARIQELDEEKLLADQRYFEMNLEDSSPRMDALIFEMKEMIKEAIVAKDKALMWVYIVEWLIVAATSLIAGSTVYALMVRRRLYREAALTRFSEGD